MAKKPRNKFDVLMQIKEELASHIDSANRAIVDDALSRAKSAQEFTQKLNETAGQGQAFVTIHQRKSQQPIYLFGCKTPIKHFKELVICGAKRSEDGEWVRDESKIITKLHLTEPQLTDVMFNHNQGEGEPVTLAQMGSSITPAMKELYITPSKRYFKTSETDLQHSKLALEELKAMSQQVIEPDFVLSKTALRPFLEKLHNVAQCISRQRDTYDLQVVAEEAENDANRILQELVSHITAEIINATQALTPLAIESQLNTVGYLDYYHSYVDDAGLRVNDHINELITKHGSKDTPTLSKNYYRHHFPSHPQHAVLSMSKTQSGNDILFGDASFKSFVASFKLACARYAVDEFATVTTKGTAVLLEWSMSPNQLMELLSTHVTGAWVRATISYTAGHYIERDQNDKYAHHTVMDKVKSLTMKNDDKAWQEAIRELQSLFNSTSKSQKHRLAIKQAIDLIYDVGTKLTSATYSEKIELVKVVVSTVKEEAELKTTQALGNIATKHPQALALLNTLNTPHERKE
ncbi:hypothetical protein QTV44_002539 [Vibrio vulnificus]|nr:hypothetical protein [Vibrio vulnificus]